MAALLERLVAAVREGGLRPWAVEQLAGDRQAKYGELTARGPRAAGSADAYALLVETVYEGYLLHYGKARTLRPDSADLALLLGDRLYALGLSQVVELGDLEALAELADMIALSAQAHATGRAALVHAVWQAGSVAIGWGCDSGYVEAKQLAFSGSKDAEAALLEWAKQAI